VTQLIDGRSRALREAVYGPLYPLAEWVAMNWWSLRHEVETSQTGRWRTYAKRHSLRAVGEGFALPDLRVKGNVNRNPPSRPPLPQDRLGSRRTRLRAADERMKRVTPWDPLKIETVPASNRNRGKNTDFSHVAMRQSQQRALWGGKGPGRSDHRSDSVVRAPCRHRRRTRLGATHSVPDRVFRFGFAQAHSRTATRGPSRGEVFRR